MNRKNPAYFNYLLCLGLTISLALFSLGYVPISHSQPITSNTSAATEVRGVWLTNVASGVLFMPGGISRAIKQLATLNFNTLYPVVWNRGHTFYPSDLANQVMGKKQEPLLTLTHPGNDVLEQFVKQGHDHGLRIIPWFEYGLIVPAKSTIATNHPDWLTYTLPVSKNLSSAQLTEDLIQGNQSLHNYFPQAIKFLRRKSEIQHLWLNPFHPQVQEFITDLIVEVVTNYDVDGIQLDDHFGMPVAMGYDPFTVKLYQQEHQGRTPPNNPRNAEWMRWRADKISYFMAKIFQAVKAEKPDIVVSLSPNPQKFSYQNYLQDWLTWVQWGLVDELVLQVYRNDLGSFTRELSDPAVQFARSRIPVSIGISTGTMVNPMDMELIQQQVTSAREGNFSGVSFFYWESLWSYLTPEAPSRRRQGFQDLFELESKLSSERNSQ